MEALTNERILDRAISATHDWSVANQTNELGANGEPMNWIICEAIVRALTHAKLYLAARHKLE